jgi:hypothetical protein
LERANLSSARLEYAQLGKANLADARLNGADLRQAIGLTQAQIDETYMDEKTILPDKSGPDGQPLRRSTRTPPPAEV